MSFARARIQILINLGDYTVILIHFLFDITGGGNLFSRRALFDFKKDLESTSKFPI